MHFEGNTVGSEKRISLTTSEGTIEAFFDKIGPAAAEEILETYKVDYRKLRQRYAEGLSRDMENEHWNFDGSPIRIDADGNLFDGQHRLTAVIMSKQPQHFLVITGLPVRAYDTTDTGLARTYGDTLRRRGFLNVTQRVALIKLIHRWEQGWSLNDTRRLTNSEMDELGDKYIDQINRAVSMAMSTSHKVDMPGALVCLSWFVLSQIDNELAYTFMIGLAEGENLFSGNPIYTLRERLRLDREVTYTRNEYMHFVFSAWNHLRDGSSITRLQLPRGDVTRDNMAVPR